MTRPKMLAAVLLWGIAVFGPGCQPPVEASLHSTSARLHTDGGILFSEYVEGSGNNKAIEIFNNGLADQSLAGCLVEIYANGSQTPTSRITLDEIDLAPGQTHVLCHTGIQEPERCQQLSYSLNHNGNDALVLRCDQDIHDSIGRVGEDPGTAWGAADLTTSDRTLLRHCSVIHGDPDAWDEFDPAAQWSGLAPDALHNLGAGCQSVLQVGSPDTLEIATWNLRNFPADDSTAPKVAELIRTMDLDLVAVQEIGSVKHFKDLVEQLDGYDGFVTDHVYFWTPYYQKTGFLYKHDLIELLDSESLFENFWYMPRPVLQGVFQAIRADGQPLELVLLNTHLKSGVSPDERDKRRRSCQKIKQYVDGLIQDGRQTRVIILGDLNDQLDDAPEYNVFTTFLSDPEGYTFETTDLLGNPDDFSLITSQRLVDHLVSTSNVEEILPGASTMVVPLELAVEDYDFEALVSDHRPVVTVFPLP